MTTTSWTSVACGLQPKTSGGNSADPTFRLFKSSTSTVGMLIPFSTFSRPRVRSLLREPPRGQTTDSRQAWFQRLSIVGRLRVQLPYVRAGFFPSRPVMETSLPRSTLAPDETSIRAIPVHRHSDADVPHPEIPSPLTRR